MTRIEEIKFFNTACYNLTPREKKLLLNLAAKDAEIERLEELVRQAHLHGWFSKNDSHPESESWEAFVRQHKIID